ncbi:TSUP family transporter [Synechococcales cyanobacterium C]|uniref:Probable membrane transporter protein n=1 Tax=Petrachloros mirabilis ULC683 TaxID=2781853 RepID=A0A8K2A714_9CYAN|nr:TSUP family transporter [Petrachloros mirabilis ULC683]
MISVWIYVGGGLASGILAGFLGIGGGTLLVPLLVTLQFSPVQAVATSSLAILITAGAGSWQNWRMGFLRFRSVVSLGLPAILAAQLGAYEARQVPAYVLLVGFGLLLGISVYLVSWRQRLGYQPQSSGLSLPYGLACGLTGGLAGLMAGFFGVGGGVIMVPLQMVLLAQPIKPAIQTSLGVIVITAASAVAGHAWAGQVQGIAGLLLGLGGVVGVQISARCLPRLPDLVVAIAFRTLLIVLAGYMFWQATQI